MRLIDVDLLMENLGFEDTELDAWYKSGGYTDE